MEYALRYGQNPHQKACVELDEQSDDPLALARYLTPDGEPISSRFSLMSWGSLNDLNRGVAALVRVAAAFQENTSSVTQDCDHPAGWNAKRCGRWHDRPGD